MQGFILLCVQAHLPQLRPPSCNNIMSSHEHEEELCPEAKGYKALIFFAAIYLVALGSGCLKPNIISHGADQFRRDDSKQSKKLSSYFNCAYFAFCTGELIALTVLVWVQTHSGMDVGFGVSAAAMAMGLFCLTFGTPLYRNKPPRGSIFTPITKVINQPHDLTNCLLSPCFFNFSNVTICFFSSLLFFRPFEIEEPFFC